MDLPVIATLIYLCIMVGGCLAAVSLLTRQRQSIVRVIASRRNASRSRDI